MGEATIELVLILLLIAINGFFAAAEIALISARRAALKHHAEQGNKGARAALRLTDNPTSLMATIQVGITVIGFGASAVAAVSLSKPIEAWLRSLGIKWLAAAAPGLGVFAVTMLVAYLSLVFGELVPKRIGLTRAEKVAIRVSGVISAVEQLMRPVVWLLTVSTTAVSKIVGMRDEGGRPGVSEEEIKLLVTEQGSLLDEEKRMIHEIFELGDTVAREIMVPRVDLVSVEDVESVAKAAAAMRESGYSRVPVYHEDRDRIVGIALLKDLVGPLAEGRASDSITMHMREPSFVPETKGILPLLSEMQTTRTQAVIVVDEYGGTAGLVTVEDIVEEVVGEIADEFDRDRKYISEVGPGDWVIDGRLPIEDALTLGLPVEESDEYETIAGWLLAQLGHIPVPGECYEVDGHEFRVQAMRRRRIARLRVSASARPAVKGDPDVAE